jgi:putative membrane protein
MIRLTGAALALGLLIPTSALAQRATSAQDFVNKAAMGDMLELESSKLAEQRADAASKQFAARMIKDHTMTSNELKSIVQKAKLQMPSAMDKEHQDKLARLRTAQGADFDRAYDQLQNEMHQNAVSLFESYAGSGDQPELKAFAAKHLPALKEHLSMARQSQSAPAR